MVTGRDHGVKANLPACRSSAYVFVRLLGMQQGSKLCGGVLLRVWQDVGVHLHRHRHLRVPETL